MKKLIRLIIIIFILSAFSFRSPSDCHAATYYVSPNGNNSSGNGTAASPWQTVRFALGRLISNDTLNLKTGRYYENNLTINQNNLTIQSSPEERAWIDAGIPEISPFTETVPNAEWELVDGNIQLYRSKKSVTSDTNLGGWLLDHDYQLMKYSDESMLKSTNYIAPGGYVGPGVMNINGRIYIRLQQNPNELTDQQGNPITPVPASTNPNNVKINLFSSGRTITFSGASNVKLQNLDIGPSQYAIEISSSASNIQIINCKIMFKTLGIVARSGGANHTITGNKLIMGYPPRTYWGDVKGPNNTISYSPAYFSGWNGFAITGTLVNSLISDNVLINCFDGIFPAGGSRNTKVLNNTIIRSRDDAIDLTADVSNMEIAGNMIRHSFEGISLNSGGATGGEVYIHHNVIDVSSYHRGERDGDRNFFGIWVPGITFGNHGCSASTCQGNWKIYNNTIITREPGRFMPLYGISRQYYNNIFYNFGSKTYTPVSGSDSAGEVFWRTQGGLSGFSEPLGLEVDPGFSATAIQELSYGLDINWFRYQPTHPQVFTTGKSYSGLSWPGIVNITYRGAVGPGSTVSPTPNPSPTQNPQIICFNSPSPIDGQDVKNWAINYLSSLFDTNSDGLNNVHEFGYLVAHWGQACY